MLQPRVPAKKETNEHLLVEKTLKHYSERIPLLISRLSPCFWKWTSYKYTKAKGKNYYVVRSCSCTRTVLKILKMQFDDESFTVYLKVLP